MENNEIYKTILKWIWIKITNKMWKAGFGRPWMINIIDSIEMINRLNNLK